ncbi:MAG: radical SAM family heme chaperone HemW [Proteobacteria bacterium]|nr:radical SAM family heme chaperone HemW [Pseudomonadota bacterium]
MNSDYSHWGIYIHVPWCHRRCSYCDFYFEIGKSDERFADAINQEWLSKRNLYPKIPAQTIYFGGGTPSTLSVEQIGKIINNIKNSDDLVANAEITLEANPEDLTLAYLSDLKEAGVNRLSLGIQSFSNPILKWLGRKHDAEMAKNSILHAIAAGFTKISVDLIVGVPGEEWSIIQQDIGWLNSVNVGHVSIYMLTVEQQTPLWRMINQGKKEMPIDDAQAQTYELLQAELVKQGYQQYEIASFARSGQESRHNRIYWGQGMYLGLGPGAHSMRLASDGSIFRQHTEAKLAEWIISPGQARSAEETLSPEHSFRESMAFGIRDLQRGINYKSQLSRHKCELPATFLDTIAHFKNMKWVIQNEDILTLTPVGARFADAVAREFLGM